ncbi:hypothetical protein [Thomasclavelia sp.]|uniref:hypothetical protein n=1 Tax=Thomasclavelia sp. TaxID=3025757 RepID=UPI0025F8B72F|nr:hypothetical protein [Thomasclavelia sp.]
MEEMKMIGTKMTRKKVIKWIMVIIFIDGFFTLLIKMILTALSLEFKIDLNGYLLLGFFIIMLIFILPFIIGSNQRIEFSSQKINYYYQHGYLEYLKETIRIITNAKEIPAISLQTRQITKVRLSYRKTMAGYGLNGYMWVLEFYLQNNSLIVISPENMIKSKTGIVYSLLELLEKMNVEIIDQNDLLPALKHDNNYFQEYLMKREK